MRPIAEMLADVHLFALLDESERALWSSGWIS